MLAGVLFLIGGIVGAAVDARIGFVCVAIGGALLAFGDRI